MWRRVYRLAPTVAVLLAVANADAGAQPLGRFSWQLAPYCNVVTVSVTQDGGLYTLDGNDDQCGAAVRASATGAAFLNPNGSAGIGLTIVTAPGATPVHVEATIGLATLSGTWHDDHGNAGTFLFWPGGPGTGSSRPLDTTVGATDIDPAEVQQRVTGSCPAGQLMTAVNENGTVACATSTVDLSQVQARIAAGCAAGEAIRVVNLDGSVVCQLDTSTAVSGPGTALTAARTDHTHEIGEPASRNTGVGVGSLGSVTSSGTNNTAMGFEALTQNVSGDGNVAVGFFAMHDSTAGTDNTALGRGALVNLVTGSGNIAIGADAGLALGSGDNNIYLGGTLVTSESNTIRIGQQSVQNRAFLMGIRGVTTGMNNAAAVVVDSLGQLGTISSSRQTKTDIEPLSPVVTRALQHLRPVQFRYRQAFADGTLPTQYGLIAEDVQDVLPELVALDQDGRPATVKYHVLPSLLLADLQRLEQERARMSDVLAAERARVTDLESRLDALARAQADERQRLEAALAREAARVADLERRLDAEADLRRVLR